MAESKVVIIVEYDGTAYCGFQLQKGVPTVQEELEKAIKSLTGEKRRVVGASRTDAGVHAVAQVVSFRTGSDHSPAVFVNGLNHYLPRDIAVKSAYCVRDSLNVQKEAISREYRYCILNSGTRSPLRQRYSYRVAGELDTGAMNRACELIAGEHDFVSFASALEAKHVGKTRRTILNARIVREKEDLVVFEIEANSFLTHQVRNTMGSLLRVGQGKMSLEEFNNIIEIKKAGAAGPGIPPCGLFLVKVNYPFSFEEAA